MAFAFVLLAGCARSAPPLPDDAPSDIQLTATEAALSCPQVHDNMKEIAESAKAYGAVIRDDRTSNQIAGYFGALFIIPLAGVQMNSDAVKQLNILQSRWDRWIDVARAKQCKFDPSLTFRGN